jgi:hypothetical protein
VPHVYAEVSAGVVCDTGGGVQHADRVRAV